MINRALVVAIALAASTAARGQNVPVAPGSFRDLGSVDKDTQTQDVRFTNDGQNRMMVDVRLSGAGPYRFMVDTGADRTAISRQLVDRLKFQQAGGAELHTVTGATPISTARLPGVQITQKPERPVDAAVLDGPSMGADGIVGVDLLRSTRVELDFEHETMSIVPSSTPEPNKEAGAIVVEARRKNGRLVITDAVANGKPVTVILDTGAELSIGNEALRQKLTGNNLIDPLRKVELESVTGQKLTGDYMFIRNLTIGGVGLANLAIVFTDAHTFKQLGLDKKPALLLGMNAIRAFKKVSIDFANRKFRVVIPEQSALETQLASARVF